MWEAIGIPKWDPTENSWAGSRQGWAACCWEQKTWQMNSKDKGREIGPGGQPWGQSGPQVRVSQGSGMAEMLAEGHGPWGMGRENCTLMEKNSGGPRPLSSDLREFAAPICAPSPPGAWGSDPQRTVTANTQGHLSCSKSCAVGLTQSTSGVGGVGSS